MRATLTFGAEVDEARLVGMQREPMPSKPFSQSFQHPFGVVVVLEGHDEVVGKANQGTLSLQAGLHLAFEPLIQHMVQEDVRKYRRDDAPNAKDNFRFERIIVGWRGRIVIDLRRKR